MDWVKWEDTPEYEAYMQEKCRCCLFRIFYFNKIKRNKRLQ